MDSATLIVNGKKAMVLEGDDHTFATVANSYKGFQIKEKGQYAEMMKSAEDYRKIASVLSGLKSKLSGGSQSN